MAAAAVMPSKMTALYYEKARHFSVIQADLPSIDENEVLLKGTFAFSSLFSAILSPHG
jgi:hypothetical protein